MRYAIYHYIGDIKFAFYGRLRPEDQVDHEIIAHAKLITTILGSLCEPHLIYFEQNN